MSVNRTDWQCCLDVGDGLLCTKALIYGSHDGPCEHVHEFKDGVCLDCDRKCFDTTKPQVLDFYIGPPIKSSS